MISGENVAPLSAALLVPMLMPMVDLLNWLLVLSMFVDWLNELIRIGLSLI